MKKQSTKSTARARQPQLTIVAEVPGEARRASQVRAEAAAWRRADLNDVDAPSTLGTLVCEALASGEDPRHFASAALEQLADELLVLGIAAEHESISPETVAKMVWRLGMRARAATEITERIREAGIGAGE